MKRSSALIAGALTLALVLTGCTGDDKKGAQSSGQAQTEEAFRQQSGAVPYPANELKDSLERRNLKERLLRTNNPSAIGYVYLLSFSKPLGYYTIKGKVSSTQSQMTTDNLVIDRCSGSTCPVVVNAPGDDGSYGANEPGIFFFTTEGAMVTTDLDYVYSDQPIPFDVPKLNKG